MKLNKKQIVVLWFVKYAYIWVLFIIIYSGLKG